MKYVFWEKSIDFRWVLTHNLTIHWTLSVRVKYWYFDTILVGQLNTGTLILVNEIVHWYFDILLIRRLNTDIWYFTSGDYVLILWFNSWLSKWTGCFERNWFINKNKFWKGWIRINLILISILHFELMHLTCLFSLYYYY